MFNNLLMYTALQLLFKRIKLLLKHKHRGHIMYSSLNKVSFSCLVKFKCASYEYMLLSRGWRVWCNLLLKKLLLHVKRERSRTNTAHLTRLTCAMRTIQTGPKHWDNHMQITEHKFLSISSHFNIETYIRNKEFPRFDLPCGERGRTEVY